MYLRRVKGPELPSTIARGDKRLNKEEHNLEVLNRSYKYKIQAEKPMGIFAWLGNLQYISIAIFQSYCSNSFNIMMSPHIQKTIFIYGVEPFIYPSIHYGREGFLAFFCITYPVWRNFGRKHCGSQ